MRQVLGAEDFGVLATAWHPRGRRLAMALGAVVVVMDVDSDGHLEYWRMKSFASSLAWHPDGNILAGLGWTPVVELWETPGGKKSGNSAEELILVLAVPGHLTAASSPLVVKTEPCAFMIINWAESCSL